MIEAEKLDPVYQSRASRLDKWKEMVQQAQRELQVPVSPPERLTFPAFGVLFGV